MSLNILWRERRPVVNETTWQRGPTLNISKSLDWLTTVKIENLWPSTSYECDPNILFCLCRLLTILADILADANLSVLPYPRHPIPFSTFPDPRLTGGDTFRFVVTSCTTPNFPYRGPSYRRAIPGFDLLAANIIGPSPSVPTDFLLFLGDFIYADVPIYIGDEKEAYRRLYRRNYQSDSFRKIYEHIRKPFQLIPFSSLRALVLR